MRKACPSCQYHWAWRLSDSRFKCRKCGHRYTFQSIWNAYRLPNKAKLKLLEYFVLGVPAYRLRFRGPCSLETIKLFNRKIRKVLAIYEHCQEAFSGEIECDESSFGGSRKGKRGWGARGKIIVLGILKRNGKVRVFPIQGRGADKIVPLVRKATKPGSLYYTDDWHAYGSLAVRGDHVVVKKEKGRPKGRDHINGIEGFWSYAKNWLYQYRGVPKKFFHFFLAEISFRFNHREQDLFPLILDILKNTNINEINQI